MEDQIQDDPMDMDQEQIQIDPMDIEELPDDPGKIKDLTEEQEKAFDTKKPPAAPAPAPAPAPAKPRSSRIKDRMKKAEAAATASAKVALAGATAHAAFVKAKAQAAKASVKALALAQATSVASKVTSLKTKLSIPNIVKKAVTATKLLLNGLPSLKHVLKILNKKTTISFDNMIKMVRSEDKDSLFGGIYLTVIKNGKTKNKKIARHIAEPYDAGQKQGPVLYGVGTGAPPVRANNYFCYLDKPNSKIPRCWALQIPLSFALGGRGKCGPDVGNAGGGTNHEMEHAIKCVTQAMLNGLSQDTAHKKELGEHTKTHNLLYEILKSIKIPGSDADLKNMTLTICKLLRKQQTIAGLPSCAIFNQSKCAIDLIKLSLKKMNDKGWFYVEVSSDKSEIKRVSGMIHSKNSKDAICKLAGFGSPTSAWHKLDTLESVYKKGGLDKLIPDKTVLKNEIRMAFDLKMRGEATTIKLITEQTDKVCSHYNQLAELNHDYSGICIAASILLLDISMNNVLATTETQIATPPGLDDLAIRAKGYLENINLKDLCDKYNSNKDYGEFFKKIELNKVTASYLKFNNTGDFWQNGPKLEPGTIPSLGGGGQGGGGQGRKRTRAPQNFGEQFQEEQFQEDTNEPPKKRPRTPINRKQKVVGDDISDEIKLFRAVETILTHMYEGGENKDNELDEFEFILNPFSEQSELENIENHANVLINNQFRTELLYATNMKTTGKTKKKRRRRSKTRKRRSRR